MQLSGMTPNPYNKPAKMSRPASKAPIKPLAKSGGKQSGLKAAHASHPNASRLGAFLHPKKGR